MSVSLINVNKLAHQIAAEYCAEMIASICCTAGDGWISFDCSTNDRIEGEREEYERCLQYLDAVGLLHHREDGAIRFRRGRNFPGGTF